MPPLPLDTEVVAVAEDVTPAAEVNMEVVAVCAAAREEVDDTAGVGGEVMLTFMPKNVNVLF